MPHIIIADGDERNLSTLQVSLTLAGFDVSCASEGQKVILLHYQCPADIVVLDIDVPKKGGIQIIMELRRDFPSVKIIALSRRVCIESCEFLDMARKIGASHVLMDPDPCEEVVKIAQKLVCIGVNSLHP